MFRNLLNVRESFDSGSSMQASWFLYSRTVRDSFATESPTMTQRLIWILSQIRLNASNHPFP